MSYEFTIVMTVFERVNLLPRALFSVLTQDRDTWELVIVADGPHPAAATMVDELLAREPRYQDRITYLTAERAPGCWGNRARRIGLERARGAYTCFMGHDCLLASGYLGAHASQVPIAVDVYPVLSVVDLQYWRTRARLNHLCELTHEAYDGVLPLRIRDPEDWRVGDIDLTCVAFPTARALALDLFGDELATVYPADALGFMALKEHMPVLHRPGVVAAHF